MLHNGNVPDPGYEPRNVYRVRKSKKEIIIQYAEIKDTAKIKSSSKREKKMCKSISATAMCDIIRY